MSYVTGEAAVAALLEQATAFNRHNVSRGDWKPLNSGASDHYAVLRPGEFSNVADGLSGEALTTYRTIIEVWQRWKDDAPTVAALSGYVAAVVDRLERYPSLDGACLMARVGGGGEMSRRWLTEGGPLWAVQEVYCDWQEERFYSSAE